MPAGRPRAQIDRAQFENLCKLQCTLAEIAGWFNVSEDTIERWCRREYKETFSAVYASKREAGKISLRRAQFRLAENNATMAIFLGKQYLHQSDDPNRHEKGETTEAKIGEFLDALTDAVGGRRPDESLDEDDAEKDSAAESDAEGDDAT